VRAEWHDFSKGLWSVGGKEHTMTGYIRRAKGLHAIRTPHLRSRDGSTKLYDLTAHSLFRFDDVQIQAAGGSLYRAGAVVTSSLNGNRLRFVPMPAQPGLNDYLFITGGGLALKLDDGGSVTTWGITNPGGPPSLAETSAGTGALANGVYKYKVVFRNGSTGSRSNAQDIDASITIASGPSSVALTNIPVSSDGQVTEREIYRTTVGGALYFLAITISDNSTTSTTDNVADADLLSFQLQTDNDRPYDSCAEVWFHDSVMWMTRDTQPGTAGRAYYSPIGRPESLLGFVEVSNTDDPCQVGFSFAESNWVMTQKNIYRITGDAEPFIPRKVYQCPGTIYPYTVVVTPFGVVYQSFDGIRLFDGNNSTLIGFEAIGPIFRGQTIENLGPFVGTTATYAKEEYIISDGTTTLAINLRLGTWRDLGIGCSALYAEQDTPNVIASFNFGVYALEDYSTVLDGTDAIDLEWELGAKISDISQRTVVQRVYIDIDTGGQLLTPTLVIDNTTIELPTFLTNSRELVEYSINRTCRLVGLRLTGQIEDVVNLYAVELDLAMGVSNSTNQQASQGRG